MKRNFGRLFYTNANGLLNKLDELKLCLSTYDIDVACITETHVSSDINDAELAISGYSFLRGDRDFNLTEGEGISGGGGSVIYYKNSIKVEENCIMKNAPDSVAIDIQTLDGKICIACIYRSTSLNDYNNNALLKCIENICNEHNDYETIITGDFNLPDVSWENGNVLGVVSSENKFINLQLEYMSVFNEKGLGWCLTNEITRRRMVNGTLQESLLDQVIYTNDGLVSGHKLLSPLGKSDHVCMNIDLGISFNNIVNSKEFIKKPMWSKISNEDILNFSKENIDWKYTSNDLNIEKMWQELHGKLMSITGTVPTNSFDCNNRPAKPPWCTSRLQRMRCNKDKAWDKFDLYATKEYLEYALMKQGIYDSEEFRLKFNYEKKLTNNLKTNSKGFFSYLRNNRQLKTCIPTLERSDGALTGSAEESAEVLADAFSAVHVSEPMGPLPEFESHASYNSSNNIVEDIVLTFDDVKNELSKLDCFKSMGPDGIHPKLLKSLSEDSKFVNALVELFRKCTDSGMLPAVWKTANVTALFKSGSKKVPLNYRPVSLTCIICKVYEKLLRTNILDFLENSINPNQHGFVKNKSCLTNLLETYDCIINLLESGAPVDLIYLDFSKAFDRVPHYRLLEKLERIGIKGKLLNIIRDFLTNRKFRVSVEGKFSSLKDILSGIPQGSVLGPLLFLIFINDLPDYVKSSVKLFADDVKIIGNATDRTMIDEDLRGLELWGSIWLLDFNYEKCKVLHTDINHNQNFEYKLNGNALKVSDQEKDLGVLTSDTLLWTDQITTSISKANKLLCWIARNLINRGRDVLVPVYKTLIRPHLEYCVQLWNPAPEHGNWSLIIKIEGVQRRFTRMIDEVGLLPYSERLEILKLTTLTERRCRGDLIEVFKAKNGFSDIKGVFNYGRSGSNLLSSVNSYSMSAKFRKIKRNFISERVISYWNKLPSDVKNSDSVDGFKINLEKFKVNSIRKNVNSNGQFWEVSRDVLQRIEGPSYLENKLVHNEFLKLNPFVAKKKFINIY